MISYKIIGNFLKIDDENITKLIELPKDFKNNENKIIINSLKQLGYQFDENNNIIKKEK